MRDYDDGFGPTVAELAEIEAEGPLIEAGLALVDVEISILTSRREMTVLDWRRWRAAMRRVAVQVRGFRTRPCRCLCLDEVAMSDCAYGCKVFNCRRHGRPRVVHFGTYGCPTGRAAVA